MISAIIAILISLAVGGAAYYVTGRSNSSIEVSRREFLIGSAISIAVLLIVGPVVEHLILSNKTKYYEYYNGYETAAVQQPIVCERDGSCRYTYSCDPYEVAHTTTDSKGNTSTYYTTEYHDCPYVTVEYNPIVQTTLGDYVMGSHYAVNPTEWRGGSGTGGIPIGPPAIWTAADNRIKAGHNGGVTKVASYKNLLLASDKTLLDQYSADIATYRSKGMLPDHTRNYTDSIYNQYMADKFSEVGLKTDVAAWNESLLRLNGYFGMQLQGDVHLVAVNAKQVKDRDSYSQALFAYWKSPQYFKKYAFPKNGIGIIVGVQDNKVVWARATGGLPVGNEALFLDIQNNLVGVDFTPDALIGLPLQKTGALYAQLWGAHKFDRPHEADYQYLASDTYVSGWNRFWIIFTTTLLSTGMWAAFLYADDRIRSNYGGY
jgi:hypothetical protein